MTTPLLPPVRVYEPSDLIAAIPHLLGFHPDDSLVVLVMQQASLGLTLRVDLPLARHRRALAEQLLAPVREHGATAVMLVVFGGGTADPPEVLPHADLIEVVDDAMASIGVGVVHAAWAESSGVGARWHCYDDVECTGVLPDPKGTALAAATAAAGLVTFASREELAALVAPVADDVLVRRSELMDRAVEAQTFEQGAGLRLVRDAVAAVLQRDEPLEDAEVVRLAMALSDRRVRDACLSFVTGESAKAAEALWLELTRGCPAPERAEPATLLAFSAYLRGDGGLASVALQQAESSCPGHRLSGLLRTALDMGLAPARITELATGAAAEARWLLAQDEQP